MACAHGRPQPSRGLRPRDKQENGERTRLRDGDPAQTVRTKPATHGRVCCQTPPHLPHAKVSLSSIRLAAHEWMRDRFAQTSLNAYRGLPVSRAREFAVVKQLSRLDTQPPPPHPASFQLSVLVPQQTTKEQHANQSRSPRPSLRHVRIDQSRLRCSPQSNVLLLYSVTPNCHSSLSK